MLWLNYNKDVKNSVVYGFKWDQELAEKYRDYFKKDILFMGLRFRTVDEDFKELNPEGIQNLLNKFEINLELMPSVVEKHENNHLLIKFDRNWIKLSYMFSLFGVLLRIGSHYDGSDVVEFLTNYNKKYSGSDAMLVSNALQKIIDIYNNKLGFKFSWASTKYQAYDIHNDTGIVAISQDSTNKLKENKKHKEILAELEY